MNAYIFIIDCLQNSVLWNTFLSLLVDLNLAQLVIREWFFVALAGQQLQQERILASENVIVQSEIFVYVRSYDG